MKHLIAILQPQQLPAIKRALFDANIHHVSCTNILGTVPNHDEHQTFRGVEHDISFFQKVRMEFFINDDALEPVVEAITKGGRASGGVGKIFVSELQDCITVKTGNRGPSEI